METHRPDLTQDIPDAKTVNKMAENSFKTWFIRDFPERLQAYTYSG
jgi:hypothetical protein